MKIFLIALGVVVVLGLSYFFWTKSVYNDLVRKDETVKAKWGNVQGQYQRRSDLIPNLVATVKGAANFEKSTLVDVVNARAKATSIQVDPNQLTPENIQKYQAAQGQLSTALGRLLVASEKYPDLKASQNFNDLQASIEGTENRIAVARGDFNGAVQDFNILVRSWPASIVANNNGFGIKGSFSADESAQAPPKVSF